jgi:hypothetical protein
MSVWERPERGLGLVDEPTRQGVDDAPLEVRPRMRLDDRRTGVRAELVEVQAGDVVLDAPVTSMRARASSPDTTPDDHRSRCVISDAALPP